MSEEGRGREVSYLFSWSSIMMLIILLGWRIRISLCWVPKVIDPRKDAKTDDGGLFS